MTSPPPTASLPSLGRLKEKNTSLDDLQLDPEPRLGSLRSLELPRAPNSQPRDLDLGSARGRRYGICEKFMREFRFPARRR